MAGGEAGQTPAMLRVGQEVREGVNGGEVGWQRGRKGLVDGRGEDGEKVRGRQERGR